MAFIIFYISCLSSIAVTLFIPEDLVAFERPLNAIYGMSIFICIATLGFGVKIYDNNNLKDKRLLINFSCFIIAFCIIEIIGIFTGSFVIAHITLLPHCAVLFILSMAALFGLLEKIFT